MEINEQEIFIFSSVCNSVFATEPIKSPAGILWFNALQYMSLSIVIGSKEECFDITCSCNLSAKA